MKKIVITGANSFIGYRLCRIFLENGWFVYAVIRRDNNNNQHFAKHSNVKIVYCDMENYGGLDKKISDSCDVGITLAWNGTRGADRDDSLMQQENFFNSVECITTFLKLGCNTVMTAGSQAEYGPWDQNRKVTEEDVCHPNTEYGRYKLEFYNKAKELCCNNRIRLIEPRFFSLYGDDDSEKTMIVSMIRNMLVNRVCELTECKQIWDFLYVDDAVRALYMLVSSKHAAGVFNFGSGDSKPLKQFILKMKKLTDSSSELKFGAVPYPATGIVNTNPSIERLVSCTGWKPVVTFEQGIRMCMERQRKIV